MHAELKNGFYSRQFIHNPARDFEHLAEQLAPYCPKHDHDFVGAVVKGGIIKSVMAGQRPEDIEFGDLSPFHQHGTAFADEKRQGGVDDKSAKRIAALEDAVKSLGGIVSSLEDVVAGLVDRLDALEDDDAIDDTPISELRAKAKALGISAGGSKQAIADRIAKHEAGE